MGAFQPVPAFELAFQQDEASAPVQEVTIPNFAFPEDTGNHLINFSVYFSGATSYSIAPAVEAGWSLVAGTGVLTVDTDDTDTFGPYTVTATNAEGDTDSNTFTISVTVVASPAGGSTAGKFKHLYRRYKRKGIN
jgi:hypothetical protein